MVDNGHGSTIGDDGRPRAQSSPTMASVLVASMPYPTNRRVKMFLGIAWLESSRMHASAYEYHRMYASAYEYHRAKGVIKARDSIFVCKTALSCVSFSDEVFDAGGDVT